MLSKVFIVIDISHDACTDVQLVSSAEIGINSHRFINWMQRVRSVM
jgi:hypothetical protein